MREDKGGSKLYNGGLAGVWAVCVGGRGSAMGGGGLTVVVVGD